MIIITMQPLQTTDTNMLRLIDILKGAGIIERKAEFYEAAGVSRQYVSDLKKGSRHFTVEQISNVCNAYNISADFVFGFSDKVFRSGVVHNRKKSALGALGNLFE